MNSSTSSPISILSILYVFREIFASSICTRRCGAFSCDKSNYYAECKNDEVSPL